MSSPSSLSSSQNDFSPPLSSPGTDHDVSRDFNQTLDVKLIRRVGKGLFPVYIAYCQSLDCLFALKMYPYTKERPHHLFRNEIRFKHLDHPNISSIVGYETESQGTCEDQSIMMSYTLTEYTPYFTFLEVFRVNQIVFGEKVCRTYFHQLIDGLEYLHTNNIAHLDLKLHNLLLSDDFVLKIADFNEAHIKGDKKVLAKGTKYYRAPELARRMLTEEYLSAADIYSAGILLFMLKTGGFLPLTEESSFNGVNLTKLFYKDQDSFWKMHCEFQNREASFFDDDFKRLLSWMVEFNPKKRATIADIKSSKWYNGPVCSKDEIYDLFSKQYDS